VAGFRRNTHEEPVFDGVPLGGAGGIAGERVARWFAAKRRYEARHPPIRPEINRAEVQERSDYLDERAKDPDEWS
jgi:hypothetical protein